eukprot:2484649-Prymnesium_polylepis.1
MRLTRCKCSLPSTPVQSLGLDPRPRMPLDNAIWRARSESAIAAMGARCPPSAPCVPRRAGIRDRRVRFTMCRQVHLC